MASKFDLPKEKYQTAALYLPERLIEAMDLIASRYPAMTRSKVAEICIMQDLEIQQALKQVDEMRENDGFRKED